MYAFLLFSLSSGVSSNDNWNLSQNEVSLMEIAEEELVREDSSLPLSQCSR